MSNEKAININSADSAVPLPTQEDERPALVKKIGKTTYRVKIHFSATSQETMSDKIKRMLRNEMRRMQ
ncbi:MAG: transposon-encoded TnpW family protein [Clostridiales bacterium]|nr:transposon-encoded TnpW family protein [Clostridiales bacterium]